MVAKVLISNGFQPDKGLGKELDGIAKPVAFQKNPEIFRLDYTGTAKERRPGWRAQGKKPLSPFHQWGHHIPRSNCEWVLPTNQELANWTAEALPELVSQKIINTVTSLQSDNATLNLNNTNESCEQDEGEGPEEQALVKLERLLEQERPKLQFGAKELETINLSKKEEVKEIWVGKQMSLDLRQKLVELLTEYADVFAWSYSDMPGLDTTIVEHRLPLSPNVVLVQ
ncbi:hypothetical protein CR513_60610, partial [Mucuna pruriens]